MATESPLLHDGSQCISNFDGRNSSITGTTLSGPNGSGQFLAVVLSTTVDRTVQLPSTTTAQFKPYGILQNKPSTGIAADVGIFGVSKAIAGTTVVRGQDLMLSSTAAGTLIPFTTAVGNTPCGRALENASTVGQVFTAAIYGFGVGPPGGV
jgi:hypothetical protein